MKKALIGLIAVVGLVSLTGCGGYETGETVGSDGRFKAVGDVGSYDVIKDTKTGCLYTESHYDIVGLSPLYDENGEVAGCGNVDDKEDF